MIQKDPIYEEEYVLDRTRAYNNLLQNKVIKRENKTVQSYAWDFNAVFVEEGKKEFTYLQDELGSIIRLLEVESEGQMIYGYDEFGKDTYNTQGGIQPFGYTGYRYDNVADTYFAQAREYVAGVGRFAGRDWVNPDLFNPSTYNKYLYCHGNPIVYIDLDGFKEGYVYYIDDFKNEATWRAKQLENQGVNVKKISLSLPSNQDTDGKKVALGFMKEWNNMDDTDTIEYVYIFSHGSERMLQFVDGSKYNALTLNGKNKAGDADVAGSIQDLQGKDIERLYIEACNTGLVEYMQVEDANVASMMSKKLTGDGAVYAWNGSVSFGPPAVQQKAYKFAGKSISYEPRSSKTQSHYEEFYNEYIAAGKIKNMHVRLGQVIYYKGEFMRNGYYPGTCITNACDGSK